jgi:hypothetical protein
MLLRNRLRGANSTTVTLRYGTEAWHTLDANAAILVAATSPKGGHYTLPANRAAECIAPALLKDQNIPKGVTVELHDYPGALDGRIAACRCAI